ncbi:MAG: tRNA1(Val) (adenine(37)-N6)-methyltransferase [Desulfobacterales bacterium]|nr:MAG: tRNA1(Val) (adenine(37)-N6)-methyltransferase [Desulfobacterales bacterium]
MTSLTTDTFFNGRIRVKQRRNGYRFSIDAVLLAALTIPRPNDKVLDLGTGSGIIPLILAYRYPDISVYGVEVQEDLARMAQLNVKENGMEDRITIHCTDMKTLKHQMVSGPVDVVVSNPPYRKANSGRLNPNQQRAVAQHEIKITLKDVVGTARNLLQTSGRFITIYPAERMTDVLWQMRSVDLEPKSLRMVHPHEQVAAKRVIVEGKKGALPGINIGPPLIIYDQDGAYSEEVESMFNP